MAELQLTAVKLTDSDGFAVSCLKAYGGDTKSAVKLTDSVRFAVSCLKANGGDTKSVGETDSNQIHTKCRSYRFC